MDELPIFISYRQVDGCDFARWLRDSLQGRTIFASEGSIDIPKTISVYLDQSAGLVDDWQELLEAELRRAEVLFVICSPGAAKEINSSDVLYFEIKWWIANRKNNTPVLITPFGQEWIPEPIAKRWPKAQTINVSRKVHSESEGQSGSTSPQMVIQRILEGISHRVRKIHFDNGAVSMPGEYSRGARSINFPGLYTWEKDKNFRYINCNDNYARAAGFDSPQAMIGKSDDDMPWRSLADFFRKGDQRVLNAEFPARFNIQENEIMVDRVADILVTENQLLDRSGACVGITGFFVDITGVQLAPLAANCDSNAGFALGPEFGGQFLSTKEAAVFKGILRKFSPERISALLFITKEEVGSHISAIMHKLQCATIGDIIATAIRAGLPFSLFGPY